MTLRGRAPVLVRNAGLNLLTQTGLILLFLVTTPIVVHGLGEHAYGVLALTVVVVASFVILDLGMSHAAVKFVSDHLARDEKEAAGRVATTCLMVNILVGLAGGAILALLAPLFVTRLFDIPEYLQEAGRGAVYLLALSFPFILARTTLQGVVASLQRFDLINLVNGGAGVLQGLVPVALLLLGFGLLEVVSGLMIVRVLACLSYLLVAVRLLPEMGRAVKWHRDTFRRLRRFSSWLILSNVVGGIMINCDRLLIGLMLSVEWVTFYAVPYGVANRLGIVQSSLTAVLFPAFSERAATSNLPAIRSLLLKSAGMLFCVLAPAALLLVILSGKILAVWMGAEYELKSTVVLQILAVGALGSALASIPVTALLGLGRSDVIAKAQSLELPVFLALSLVLIPRMGIGGAAAAWLGRVALDLVLLYSAAWRSVSPAAEARAANPGPDAATSGREGEGD